MISGILFVADKASAWHVFFGLVVIRFYSISFLSSRESSSLDFPSFALTFCPSSQAQEDSRGRHCTSTQARKRLRFASPTCFAWSYGPATRLLQSRLQRDKEQQSASTFAYSTGLLPHPLPRQLQVREDCAAV